ncbi:MAG: metal ABC transporter permease [Candidatus Moranbacteria bacterium]|nr:metal ABC transporter permease [Candidatus Moranbacteria bacterium]
MSFFDIFQFDFFVRAFEAGLLLSIIAPLIGMFLVVRRYSLFADALSHVSLLGVALALMLKIPVLLGTLFTALLAAFGIERLRMGGRVFGEAVIALFLSSSLALSVVLLGLGGNVNANLLSYLFGSLTTVTVLDVVLLLLLFIGVSFFLLFFYRELFLFSLDEDLAAVSGVRTRLINGIFVALAAVCVAAVLQIVGALLVGALLVVPVLAAMQWRMSFRRTLFLAIFFSFLSVNIGFFAAYFFDIASGGTIVICTVLFFLGSFFAHRRI